MNEITEAPVEDDLLARARTRDEAACTELARRHAPLAKRTAVLWGAGDDADDVVQAALVKALTHLDSRRKDAPFGPWLARIVINETKNLHRERARRTTREEKWTMASLRITDSTSVEPENLALTRERRTELLTALDQLSSRFRSVITCRYLLDLNVADTAAVLQLSEGTVKSRLHRGLAKLRKEVNNDAAD